MRGKPSTSTPVSIAGWLATLVLFAALSGWALFDGIRTLEDPAICDGQPMSADDTCYRLGRGGPRRAPERLSQPTTTVVKLPPRPVVPPGMGPIEISDPFDGRTEITATVRPEPGGASLDEQVSNNRIYGIGEIVVGAALLGATAFVAGLTWRGYRRHRAGSQ